jgi:hypothetical protein
MKTVKDATTEEMADIFHRVAEGLVAQKKDSTADKVQAAIHASRNLFKQAVRQGTNITAIRKHLESLGLKCTSECLRVALIKEGIWSARAGKTSPAGGASAPG